MSSVVCDTSECAQHGADLVRRDIADASAKGEQPALFGAKITGGGSGGGRLRAAPSGRGNNTPCCHWRRAVLVHWAQR